MAIHFIGHRLCHFQPDIQCNRVFIDYFRVLCSGTSPIKTEDSIAFHQRFNCRDGIFVIFNA